MQEIIERYLKSGHSYDFNYDIPPEIDFDADLLDSCLQLDKMAKEQVMKCHHEYENPVYLLSGGLDSSWVVSYLRQMDKINTACISSWNEADVNYAGMMAREIESNHMICSTISMTITQELLHEYVDKSSLPTCLPIGLFWFLASKRMKREGIFDAIITGDGIDTMMVEDPVEQAIRIAIVGGDYSIEKAQKYAKDSYLGGIDGWIPDIFREEPMPDNYIGNFRSIYDYLFTDDELKELGLDVFEYKLRDENLYDLQQIFLEYKQSTNKMFFSMSELPMRSPLFEDPILSFSMSLPFEMRECLNVKKLPVRELCFRNGLPMEIVNRKKIDWKSPYANRTGEFKRYHLPFDYSVRLDDMTELIDEYLENPIRKIYKYIDFDKCEKHLNYDDGMTMKLWSLLLLSMWLEKHK